MRASDTGDVWWKSAVFYCADVETFCDSDGDRFGDLRGMTERLEYLVDLGVTCLWLMPFYPTARKDDGYDITGFFGVDPKLGTHGDMQLYGRGLRRRLPAAGGDERRRTATAARVLADLLAAGNPCALQRRGDRHGGEPRRPRPARGAHADAVDRRAQRRLLDRAPPPACAATARRTVRSGASERGRPAPRPGSLWWFVRGLIYRYRRTPQIGWSTVEVLDHDQPAVLAHLCREPGGWTMLALHNFGADGCLVTVRLPGLPRDCRLADLVGPHGDRGELTELRSGRTALEIDGFGGRWLQVLRPGEAVPL